MSNTTELFYNSRLVYHPRSWLTSWPQRPLFYTDKAQCARVEKIPLRDVVATSYIGGDGGIYKEPPHPSQPQSEGVRESTPTCRGTKKKRK